jgi:LacI family transcriptional regulator
MRTMATAADITPPPAVTGAAHPPAAATRGHANGTGSARVGGPAKRVSMREVAKQADVSVATVSMVLNDNPRISKATHLRVQRVMDKLGYRPNRLAQSLSSSYTRVLAVLLPPLRHAFSDPYFGELLSGICDRADRLGHKVMLEAAKPDFIRDKRHIELFERRYVDGILALGFNDRHGFLRDFADRTYPVMSVNNPLETVDLDHVVCDYRGGAEQVMNCLLQLGHRRIAMIAGAPEAKTTRLVRDVFFRRMHEAGFADDDVCIADGRFTEEGGAAAANELMDRCPQTTAIFAGNDKMALGAMHAMFERGMKVPGDVSIVGFDDIQQMAFVNPALTTVHLPLYEVGARACERLVERVRGKDDLVRETLPTHLVLRESTGIARDRR